MRYAFVGALLVGAVTATWLVLRPAPAERPDVLLVTIDTLRADTIGTEPGTPAILGFLQEATRFSRTRTIAPLTLPSHVSILTGLLAATHGMHDNVTESLPEKRPFPLLAEQFRDSGYETAAFLSSGVLGRDKGIAWGFDRYECPAGEESVLGDERVKAAIEYLKAARKGKPRFVWVHLFDPHAPCRPYPGDARRPGTSEGDSPRALYVGGVRRADAAFEKLLAAAGNAVVVLASDHGESFGEHDELTHGVLCYGTTTDVLLAVRGPGFGRGVVDEGLRCLTDIAPTLRGLCDLPEVPTDGRDLHGPPHETVVTESLFTFRVHGWGQCFSVTDGEFTLVESGSRLELFDRSWDPLETQPLPLAHPAYEKLDRALERLRSAATVAYGGELCESISAYGQLRLDATGYLPRFENAKLLDPRPRALPWMSAEGVPFLVDLARARQDQAPLNAALKLVSDFEQVAGKSPLVHVYRALIYEAMAQITGERTWLGTAARQRVEAVENGYSHESAIREAIRCAEAAQDHDALQMLAEVVNGGLRRYSPELVRALDEAMRKTEAQPPSYSAIR